jgi:hypothetical protein
MAHLFFDCLFYGVPRKLKVPAVMLNKHITCQFLLHLLFLALNGIFIGFMGVGGEK